ncbi:MAG: hypothetical protein E2O53_09130 [Gammaproteobacteria bacterium]|nr:MAG: hypothetical protein E2O53_09130 [Gammaproteobacteria bacterium]
MTDTRKGLRIVDQQSDDVIQHLGDAMDRPGAAEPGKQALLSILRALRAQIVAH